MGISTNHPKVVFNVMTIVFIVGMAGALWGHAETKTLEQPFLTYAKPVPVIQWSNGFPSGEHFNLNIHGKKADFACNPTPGGNSVFVLEYGQSELQFIQNKRSSLTNLYVI